MSKKDYIAIGRILAQTNAPQATIEAFVLMFAADNYRFDAAKFRAFVANGGK